MRRSEAAQIVAMLVAAYRDKSVTEATVEVYETMLSDLDFEACKAAVTRVIATAKWFPTVAEIRHAAASERLGAVRAGGEAYGDVVSAIRSVGSYRPAPTFDDPVVNECVRIMTWRGLCLGDNEAADRARFIELYDSLAARSRADVVAGRALPSPAAGFRPLPAITLRALPEPSRTRPVTLAELDEALAAEVKR